MADIVVDTEITDPKELVKVGLKAYILRDYNSAVSAYSRAIELAVAEHGDKHDSLGEIYLSYGRTLLDISREEAEALGDAVPREFSSDSEAEEDNNENTAKEKKEGEEQNGSNEKEKSTNGADKTKADNEEEKPKADGEAGDTKAEDESTEDKADADPTDLQLAWEVLELAKLIFEKRGDAGRKGLSETLVLLGDVSLESENFESAVTDIKAGLEIQKQMFKPDNRTLAETYYKLGIALSTNNQIEESIESYNGSLEVLNKRLVKLKEDEVNQKDEIKDIEGLIPDIQEKIADMKSFKLEATSRLIAAVASKPITETKFESGSSSTSSDKKICDISHLVKRKRKLEDVQEEPEEKPTKRPSQ